MKINPEMRDDIIDGLAFVLKDQMAQGDPDGTSMESLSIKAAISEIIRLRAIENIEKIEVR